MDLKTLTVEHKEWLRYNFPDQTPDQAFLGVVEEVGEIAHTLLKYDQGIREFAADRPLRELLEDGVGDLVIFLDGFCVGMGIDLSRAVEETWQKVKRRNWIEYPKTGLPEE